MPTDASSSRPRLRRGLLAGALTLAVAVGGWVAVRGGMLKGPSTAVAAAEVPTGTARVTRADVVQRQQVPAILGYAGATTVVAQTLGGSPGNGAGGPSQGGILTRLPAPGAVLGRGDALYEVDGRAVVLWYGTRPAWRAFQLGMANGPDVGELEANLVALGFDPDRAITVDDHFTLATGAAVRRWQRGMLGLPPARRTGEIPFGGVVFLPGPIRVTTVTATLGAPIEPGAPILAATSTRPVVTVALDPALQQLVHAGNRVQVLLPSGRTTSGTVIDVSRVAVVLDAGGGQDGGQGQGGNGNAPGPATISVTVRLADPRAAQGLDQAPVQVAITSQAHRGVLAVPILALLARPRGGYAVEVVSGGGNRRVPVRTGLFDETAGLVEIAGSGLAEGTMVEVPAP